MKTSHRFTFKFDEKLLVEEYQNIFNKWDMHYNTGFYEGEWSGIALRKSRKEHFELSAGHSGIDDYVDTPLLKKLFYIQKVLDFFECEKTSVRILKLTPGSSIKAHSDEGLNFFDGFVRFHIPIVTNEHIKFEVDGVSLKMMPGECWFADFSKTHTVCNDGQTDRLHLVIDLKVNPWLHKLFIDEGILRKDEKPPDIMDGQSDEYKMEVVKSLLLMDTPQSIQMAKDLTSKYDLVIK